MYEVMTKVDSSDYKHVNYYVLGTSTGKYLATKGLKVKVTEKIIVLMIKITKKSGKMAMRLEEKIAG